MTTATAQTPGTTATPDDLRQLLRTFDQTTRELQGTHLALQSQVTQLQQELAEANARLRRSRSLAALGEMAAGIAHEIRNPLGSISLYVEVLAEDVGDRPDAAATCEKIARAVAGLDGIVQDVLSFARDTTIRPAPTSTVELFDRALATGQGMIERSGVSLQRQTLRDVPFVADSGLIAQALGNVIRNAVEAVQEHGVKPGALTLAADRLRVRCPDGRRGERIVMSVTDNGPGIPGDVAARMFNPFFTTRATGTGLGLAIVHRIVDAHGGHLSVSNAPGGGAQVQLCLPTTPEPPVPSSAVAAEEPVSLAGSVARRLNQKGDS